MDDTFARYVQGLEHVRAYLKKCNNNQNALIEVDFLQCRLDEIVSVARMQGDGPRSDERIKELLTQIIKFTQVTTDKSFKDWCDEAVLEHIHLMPQLPEKEESTPDDPSLFTQSESPEQTGASPPFLPLPIQTYVLEMFELLQKAQPLIQQERADPFELAPIRQLLQQNNRGISPEIIASIKPITPTHTALVVAVNYVKECTEEITKLLSEFEVICHKSNSKKQRQFLQEKLDMTIYYMQQYPDLVSQ